MPLKCPITKKDTEQKCHRQCTGHAIDEMHLDATCRGKDCYVCCFMCKVHCQEPPRTLETIELAEGLDLLAEGVHPDLLTEDK